MTNQKSKDPKKQWIVYIALLPILLFAVFHLYTKEARTDLSKMKYPRKMYPVGLDTVTQANKTRVDTIYHTIPDFSFTSQYNQVFSKADFDDKIIIADFFFTKCPTICPKMSEQLARVQKELIRDDRVVILSFSIDPQRDTPEVLKEYADEYGAVPGKWFFFNGEKDAIYDIAKNGFKLSADDEGGDKEHDGFLHTDRFVLLDPNWNIRGYYNGTSEKQVNILMGDVLLLLEEFKR